MAEQTPSWDFSLDARRLTASAITAVRVGFAVSGVAAIVIGALLLFWPTRTLVALAILLGVYFIIAGVVRLALGVFAHGLSGGHRALSIVVGALLLLGGIVALRNSGAAALALVFFATAFLGIGWIFEGIGALVESSAAPSRGLAIAFGVLSIVAGIVVLVAPISSAIWLLVFAGVSAIVLGAIGIVRAITFGRSATSA